MILLYLPSEISHLKMAGDEQTDASGKYGMNGRAPQGAARYWPTIFKVVELVSYFDLVSFL